MDTLARTTRPSTTVRQLAEMIQQVERRPQVGASEHAAGWGVVPTGWEPVDAALTPADMPDAGRVVKPAGLERGALHEWFGAANPLQDSDIYRSALPDRGPAARGEARRGRGIVATDDAGFWTPPLCILTHLAWQAIQAPASPDEPAAREGWVVWVGRSCWPHPPTLFRAGNRRLLERSIFVDPPNDAIRLWLLDLCLRCPAVAAVIGDGSRLNMAATRRLQLAAGEHGCLALLARPPQETSLLSAARTRWLVRRTPVEEPPVPTCEADLAAILNFPRAHPRWSVELLRCKSSPQKGCGRAWLVEWNGATGAVAIPAGLVDRPVAAPSPAARVDGRGVSRSA